MTEHGTTRELTVEEPNSCEISINAKRQWSGKVKAYADTLPLAYNVAVMRAEALANLISEKNNRGVE